jgi:hypothetical protein
MELVKHHHHFRKELIEPSDRVALCERYIIDELLTTTLPDSGRESSIAWELKHHSGVTQMARLLARKRGLPLDTCTVGALLHDVYVIVHGSYANHAHLGAPIAARILGEVGGFDSEETNQVFRIVYDHSDKHILSDDPFEEFGKDADILDIFLYPGPYAEYLLIKPLPVLYHYLARAKKIWAEIGLPTDPRYDLLKNYSPSWFSHLFSATHGLIKDILATLLHASSLPKEGGYSPPAFCLLPKSVNGSLVFEFHGNKSSWEEFCEIVPEDLFPSSSRAALGKLLTTPPSTIIDMAEALLSPHGLNPEAVSTASHLLESPDNNHRAFIFWPLSDLYEVIDNASDSTRLRELGVVN